MGHFDARIVYSVAALIVKCEKHIPVLSFTPSPPSLHETSLDMDLSECEALLLTEAPTVLPAS
jgi:hypothetical protein